MTAANLRHRAAMSWYARHTIRHVWMPTHSLTKQCNNSRRAMQTARRGQRSVKQRSDESAERIRRNEVAFGALDN